MPDGFRTVILENHERIGLKNGALTVQHEEETATVPLNQIRDLVIAYPTGSITLQALYALNREKVNLLLCDEKQKPYAVLLPCSAHTEAAGRLMDQAAWTEKRKQSVWKQIVKQKLTMQAMLLAELNHPQEKQLRRWAGKVRLNDATNREGLGAKLYFSALFGSDFIRHAADDTNAALNYGYTILCTLFVRLLWLHGYHPALGLHHCSRCNAFNLACDLMEPFRPIVDRIVVQHIGRELTRDYKHELIAVLQSRFRFDGRQMKTADAAEQYLLQVLRAMQGERVKIGEVAFGESSSGNDGDL